MENSGQPFIEWLEERHKDIMGSEKAALDCLDAGDKSGYASHMRDKASKLRDLHRQAIARLGDIPELERGEIEDRLSRFSSGAGTALSLDSLFYMSALLYPDDHKEGEPDNLLRLIEQIKNRETAK